MSRDSVSLRGRREVLLRRSARQRLDLKEHLQQIEASLDGVDRGLGRGLGLLRRAAAPPLLFAAGLLVTSVLGRRRAKRALISGLSLIGQLVRRSR